ncbi:hypothetical protein [Paenirhodobacter populi]
MDHSSGADQSSNRRSAGKRDERALQQINDRIGMTVHLPNLDGEDCDKLAQAYCAEGEDARLAISALGSKTNARNLARVLQRAKAETQDSAIRLSNLKNAVLGIYGKTDILREFVRDAQTVPGIDLGKRVVNTLMNSFTLTLEIEQAALATDPANYGGSNKLALTRPHGARPAVRL